jgi:hypothetical protein
MSQAQNVPTAQPPHSIRETLHQLKQTASGQRVSLGALIDRLGQRSYGPVLFVLGLVALSPVGAIPGASIVCATAIVLIAAQMSFGRPGPWVPGALRRIEVDARRGRRALEATEPYVRWLDRVTRRRWRGLLRRPALHLVVVTLCVLAGLMYPLALVPWGVVPVAATIALIGLGLLTADGVVIAAGLAAAALATGGGAWMLAA